MSSLLQDVDPNLAAANPQQEDLSKLTIKALKERCKSQGLKVSGKKGDLIERLENPSAPTAKRQKTGAKSNRGGSLSTKAVNDALEAAGYNNPERASGCARKAIQKGFFSIDNLDETVFSGECQQCNKTLSCTLRDVLDQSDYGGGDYEDGGQGGALQCEDCESGCYVTSMCEGHPQVDSGKFHNHCGECPGFGKCIGDYREAHCSNCGRHYFAGLSGFPCSCQANQMGGYDGFDY